MGRRNKYGAVKTVVDGIKFDSKAEAVRYRELCILEKMGEISGLETHPPYVILEAYDHPLHGRLRAIKYEADFFYYEGQTEVVEDVKGKETAVFKIKRKMFLQKYPHIDFRLIPASDYH